MRARGSADPDRVIAVGGCYAEAQRERIFELYPYVDVAFGPGSIPHLGDWLGAGGVGVARGRFGSTSARSPGACRCIASARSRRGCRSRWAATPLLVLHRPGRARPRAEPPPGRHPRRGHAARRRRRQGDHPSRPERQLVGPRPRARHPHRVRRAAPCVRRRRRDRADPVHEPAPEGLPRAGDRARSPSATRSASTSTCRSSRGRRGSSRRCGAPTIATATSPSSPSSRAAIPDSPSAPTSSSASRARRRRTSGDARGRRGGRLRQRVHLRVLAAPRHGGGCDAGSGARTRRRSSAWNGWSS